MKKVLFAFAAVAMAGCFCSCDKTCTCTTWALGTKVSTSEVDMSNYKDVKKCSELPMAIYDDFSKTGTVCE